MMWKYYILYVFYMYYLYVEHVEHIKGNFIFIENVIKKIISNDM